MKTYLFETSATMKEYNNKNWWIDSGIIRNKLDMLSRERVNFKETITHGVHNILIFG